MYLGLAIAPILLYPWQKIGHEGIIDKAIIILIVLMELLYEYYYT